jgi:heme oxygenase
MAFSASLMNDLREGTAALHAATEALPLMRNLMAPEVTVEIYRDYLAALAKPYRAVEPRLHQACGPEILNRLGVRPKLPALERDLTALGLDPQASRGSADESLADLIRDQADALGGLYVLEGATLGGRVIAQQLQRHLGGAAAGLSFEFLGTRDQPSPSAGWRHFAATLEAEVGARQHDRQRILSAAVGVFEFVHQALRHQVLDQELSAAPVAI